MKSIKIYNKLFVKIFLILLASTLLPLAIALFTKLNLILVAGIGLITLVLTLALMFSVLKPLKKILQTTENLKSGNLNSRLDIRSGDEFEEWANSFNSVAAYLQQSLTHSEQGQSIANSDKNRLTTILSSIIDGIIAVDLSKNTVLVNKAAEKITGFTENELINRPIDQFIHIFEGQQEILFKDYCRINFSQADNSPTSNKNINLVGKNGKQTKVSIFTAPIAEGVQSNLGCILILHDLSSEQELEQMKLDFVSMASHELRTPLTSIVGYLSVFVDENKGKLPKEEMELIDRSLVSSKQLLILVGNLLSVNKIEKEQFILSKEPMDWQAALKKSVEDLQNQAKLKNITLVFKEPQTPLPKVLADPLRTSEVVNNLVSNAINYTSTGGTIEVLTNLTPDEVITTVSDNGIGIPKEAIPHLFNKFYRVSNQLQKANKGTGLGLYISKSIVTQLGGEIWVESEVGKGTKFHFSLQIAPTPGIQNQQFVNQALQSGSLNY